MLAVDDQRDGPAPMVKAETPTRITTVESDRGDHCHQPDLHPTSLTTPTLPFFSRNGMVLVGAVI